MKGPEEEKERFRKNWEDIEGILLYMLYKLLRFVTRLFDEIYKMVRTIMKKIKQAISPKTDAAVEELKALQDIIETELHLNSPLIRDYKEEQTFWRLAGALQIISFFTTYEGSALYFGNLFTAAPFLVALVVQLGLYKASKMAFSQGSKRVEACLIMLLLLSCSIVFSYGGIYASYDPPKVIYEETYDAYQKVGEEILQDLSSRIKSDEEMIKELDSVIIQIVKNKEAGDEALKTMEEENIDPQATISTTQTQTTRQKNGKTETRSTISASANANYGTELEAKNALEQKIASLRSTTANIETLLNKYEIGEGTYSASDALKKYLSDSDQHMDDLNVLYNDMQSLISYNGQLCEVQGIDSQINENSVSNYGEMLLLRTKETELKEVLNLKADSSADAENSDSNMAGTPEHGKMGGLYLQIKKFLGLDFHATPMEQFSELKTDIKKKANDIESIVNLLPDVDPGKKECLEEEKKKIEELPDAMVYAVEKLFPNKKLQENGVQEEKKSVNAAYICLAIAGFNDGLTVLFCLLAARKRYSFSYVKTSKDYYTDKDSLFELVFRSMMDGKEIKPCKADSTTDFDEFKEKCKEYVRKTSKEIRDFLDKMQLSPCTANLGFNMYIHLNGDDIHKYEPIISVLLKTNLAKVIPYTDYQELECKYYTNQEIYIESEMTSNGKREDCIQRMEKEKDKGDVFLLRNRAENSLREHLSGLL